jgi:hypothetical protein
MPVVIQERVLAELGDWLDLTLPAAAPEPVTARVPASSLLVD